MKKEIKRIVKLVAIALLATQTAMAQKTIADGYKPMITWPFLFSDFQDGIMVVGEDSVSQSKLNFHLRSEALDCIDANGKIARIIFPGIKGILIDHQTYRFIDGHPMRQLFEEDGDMLMEYYYIDYDLMGKGYNEGMALYARENFDVSIRANWHNFPNYKELHMPGEFNELYTELKDKRHGGMELPVKLRYYFVIGGKTIAANSSSCGELLDKQGRKQLASFIKANKLKWKTPEHLITILQYLRKGNLIAK